MDRKVEGTGFRYKISPEEAETLNNKGVLSILERFAGKYIVYVSVLRAGVDEFETNVRNAGVAIKDRDFKY